ncbi:MAG: hypothetical protein ABJA81_04565 [Nocardioidaceae bacterium]
MGLTGVIYAAIVMVWAAYLVPLALRRHDEAARKRSIERFSSAMRVLSRRGSRSGERGNDRMIVTPPRGIEAVSGVDRLLTPTLSVNGRHEPAPLANRPSRAAMRSAAERRRRVLIVLVAVTGVTAVVSILGLIAWWSFAIPLALIVAFLMVARRQVRMASESYWTEVAEHRPEPSNVVRRPAARVDATHGAVKQPEGYDEPTVTLNRDDLLVGGSDLVEERVVAVSVETADGESLWDPLPVTLPTYVDAPVAKRSFRTIDLGEPGTWSSGHAEEASKTVAGEPADPVKKDEIVDETPRAVNG